MVRYIIEKVRKTSAKARGKQSISQYQAELKTDKDYVEDPSKLCPKLWKGWVEFLELENVIEWKEFIKICRDNG